MRMYYYEDTGYLVSGEVQHSIALGNSIHNLLYDEHAIRAVAVC